MSNLKERLADMSALSQSRTPADALKYIEELEAKLAELEPSMVPDPTGHLLLEVRYANYVADVATEKAKELEAENTTLRSMVEGMINDTGDDPEIMAASRAEWAHRALEAEAKLAKEIEISNQRGNHIEFVLTPQMSDLQFQLKDVKAQLAKAIGIVDDMIERGTWYGLALSEILQRRAELKGEK